MRTIGETEEKGKHEIVHLDKRVLWTRLLFRAGLVWHSRPRLWLP